MTEILDRIDEALTYYSAGLGEDVTVPVERDEPPPPALGRQWRLGAASYDMSVPGARTVQVRVVLDADSFVRATRRMARAVADVLGAIAEWERAEAERVRAAAERRAWLRRMRIAYRRRNR